MSIQTYGLTLHLEVPAAITPARVARLLREIPVPGTEIAVVTGDPALMVAAGRTVDSERHPYDHSEARTATMNPSNELETAVRALRAIREQKLQDIAEIDRSIAELLNVISKLPEGLARAKELGDISDRFSGLSIPKAAEAFLRDVKGEPATTKEISDALLRGGIRTNSRSFEATVYSRLQESTSPRFRRTPDGRGWWIVRMPLPHAAWGVDAEPESAMGAQVHDGAVQ